MVAAVAVEVEAIGVVGDDCGGDAVVVVVVCSEGFVNGDGLRGRGIVMRRAVVDGRETGSCRLGWRRLRAAGDESRAMHGIEAAKARLEAMVGRN